MLHFMSVAELVKTWRRDAQLSQRALAQRAGVFPSTIRRIENGDSDPTVTMLERIAAAIGRRVQLTSEPVSPETLAGLTRRLGTGDEPDWLELRAFGDWTESNLQGALDAVRVPPPRSGSARIDNLLAAVAEVVADTLAADRPRWTRSVDTLEDPWWSPGTPAMQARVREEIPQQFAARGVMLPAGAVWHRGGTFNP